MLFASAVNTPFTWKPDEALMVAG